VKYLRLYNDSNGDSRFQEVVFSFTARDFAPPAPAVAVSDAVDASSFMMLRLLKGWHDPAHPVPARQFMIVIEGFAEVRAGDEVRILSRGDVMLAEDTNPPGHGTTILADAYVAVVRV
jgi:hypothetical protein